MVFNTGAALLDAIVLAVVSKEPEGTYGYKITQDVRGVLDISESTLYPVLRRLQDVYKRQPISMPCQHTGEIRILQLFSGWCKKMPESYLLL